MTMKAKRRENIRMVVKSFFFDRIVKLKLKSWCKQKRKTVWMRKVNHFDEVWLNTESSCKLGEVLNLNLSQDKNMKNQTAWSKWNFVNSSPALYFNWTEQSYTQNFFFLWQKKIEGKWKKYYDDDGRIKRNEDET